MDYEMLLKELQKSTPTNHPDYENVENAIKKLKNSSVFLFMIEMF